MKYDVVIIGSGVAGLTSAIYTARGNKSTLIIENESLGGTTATLDKIENYPGYTSISGFDLINNMYNQVVSLGVKFMFDNINFIDFDNNLISMSNENIEYGSLIIAGGCSYRKLNATGEDKYKLNGISYCAVCDGALYKNKNIVVITDGYIGKSSIEYLSNLTDNLTILDISSFYKDEKHKVINNVKIIEFIGDNKIRQVKYRIDNQEHIIDCDGVFISLGKSTDITLYENKIKCTNGYICTDENMHTNISNVFVAGDIREKSLRQIITACADGAIAGTEAIKYLSKSK